MDRRRGEIGKLLLKWLAVPLALLVVGYFLVGPFVPRILGMRAPIKSSEPKTAVEATSDEPTYGEPEVDISASPAGRSYSSTRSDEPRRKRRTTPKPAPQEEPPIEEPPVDDPPVDDPPVVDPPPTTGDTTGSTTGDVNTTGTGG